MSKKSSFADHNILEKVGIISLPILVCAGLLFYIVGTILYLLNNWNNSKDILLPILISIPFTIQIPILFKFLKVLKSEIRDIKESDLDSENGLSEFFKYYCWFMGIGLLGYSLPWWIYNYDFKSWQSGYLTLFSILTLTFILILIWIIIICTRIIIRSGKSEGLLTDNDLPPDEYEKLFNKLSIILENDKLLKKTEDELRTIITTQITGSKADPKKTELEEQKKIPEIINIISSSGQISLPLKSTDPKVDKIIAVLTDKEQPVRIKPIKRVLALLREQANNSTYKAIKEKDLSSVTKSRLIRSLNNILMNYQFYRAKDFSSAAAPTPVITADTFFKTKKQKVHRFAERVQIENRHLFDVHLLFEDFKPDSSGAEKENWRSGLNFLFRFRLNDYKERKIIEGITRYPFQILLFFFTTFICIVYLFAFTFAFHDQSTLNNSLTKTPALFTEANYPNLDSKSQSNSSIKTESSAEKHSTFFFFYTLANSGTEYRTNNVNADPQSRRYAANSQNLDGFLDELSSTAPAAKKILVEIVGRTDDTPVNIRDDPKSKQTYSSNYDLSLARAQNLKFELLRQIQAKTPDILEKIEWSCLPGSNDSSLTRASPLNYSNRRQSIALSDSSINEKTEPTISEIGDPKEMIGILQEQVKTAIPTVKDSELNNQLLKKKKSLQNQAEAAMKLLALPDTAPPPNKTTNSTQTMLPESSAQPKLTELGLSLKLSLSSKLREEFEAYKAIMDGPKSQEEYDKEDYARKEKTYNDLNRNIESALVFFASEADNSNKRVSEVYVVSIPYSIPSNPLNLMDYILYSITSSGYGDIKPTTLYAKFLSILVNIVAIFFVVVFFNALLTVKRVNEGDESFYTA